MAENIEQEDQNAGQAEQGQKSGKTASPASENKETNTKPLTTQGTQEEISENLGGTTNLSLDQLKKEGDAGH